MATTDYSPNSMGRVVQVIGPVVDVAFDSAELPDQPAVRDASAFAIEMSRAETDAHAWTAAFQQIQAAGYATVSSS